jgi:hypothetical protein
MGTEAIQGAVVGIFQNWLMAHPILGWGVTHPLLSLGMGLVLFFVLWGLLRAIAQLTERLWVILLRVPIRLGQWIFRQLPNIFRFQPNFLSVDQTHLPTDREQHLRELLLRLEHLQREQALLLQDIKNSLEQDAPPQCG